jgi:hypothetical protein
LKPPPATHIVYASMWWSRPIVSRLSPIGVRPNSPPHTTTVLSSRFSRLRSFTSAAQG